MHTPLHRLLGERAGPLTDQMIDAAVTHALEESDELDWKTNLPDQKLFRDSDYVKDIAAFANAGGGMLVFGVKAVNKAASTRVDAGDLTESYERTIQQVCLAGITPPLFGVQAIAVPSTTGTRAVALLIPDSADGPHLVYRNDYFGAPLRVGADTHWMKEREVESAYRTRFEAARRGEEALNQIIEDMTAAIGTDEYAVLVGAARPRSRRPRAETRVNAAAVGNRATLVSRWWLSGFAKYHPLEDIDIYAGRPTLSGQHFPPELPGDYREAHAVILDDGAVGLSWRAGGHEHYKSGNRYAPHQIDTLAIEGFASALVALIHAVAAESPGSDYEVVIGVELNDPGGQIPEFHERNAAPPSGVHRTLSGRFRAVRATVDPSVNDTDFIQSAIDLAKACLNQIGLEDPSVLSTKLPQRPLQWWW